MNFNLYLDAESVRRLDKLARREKTARNALIRRAVTTLLDSSARDWPPEVQRFVGDPSFPPFESHRAEMAAPIDDPFASRAPKRSPTRKPRSRKDAR